MHETIAKRCLQGVLGGKAKRHSEDIQGEVDTETPFLADTKEFLYSFLQASIRLCSFSPFNLFFHSVISHCFQGVIQNFSTVAKPGMFWSLHPCPGSPTSGLSFPGKCYACPC